jgi:hypothetical protein
MIERINPLLPPTASLREQKETKKKQMHPNYVPLAPPPHRCTHAQTCLRISPQPRQNLVDRGRRGVVHVEAAVLWVGVCVCMYENVRHGVWWCLERGGGPNHVAVIAEGWVV